MRRSIRLFALLSALHFVALALPQAALAAAEGDEPGWEDAGKQGTKAECLADIEEIWTDMRPLSLRKKMEAQAAE